MDYNRLFTFIKVAELSSISAAARELFRTQSAITQQIQALEEELGIELFERRQARIFLSPIGKQIFESVAPSFGSIDDTVQQVRADMKSLSGRIRLGALNDQSTEFDPVEFICRFRRKFPLVDVSMVFATNQKVEELLLTGDIELGINIVFSQRERFERREIATGTHMFVAAAKLLDKHGPLYHYDDIFSLPLIDLSDDFICIRAWFLKNKPLALEKMHRLRPNLVFSDHASTRKAAIEGLGGAVLPQHLIAGDLNSGKLRPVMPAARNLRVGLDIAYRKGRPLRLVERELFMFGQ